MPSRQKVLQDKRFDKIAHGVHDRRVHVCLRATLSRQRTNWQTQRVIASFYDVQFVRRGHAFAHRDETIGRTECVAGALYEQYRCAEFQQDGVAYRALRGHEWIAQADECGWATIAELIRQVSANASTHTLADEHDWASVFGAQTLVGGLMSRHQYR